MDAVFPSSLPHMTATEATVPAAKPASLWEDFIDIFYAPSTVFERRRNANPWPMILIVTGLILLLSVITFNSLVTIIEPMTRRAMEKAAAANPQISQDILDKQLSVGMKIAPWFPVITPILMLIGAFVLWLVGKLFGSKATYTQSLLIVAYASITYVVTYLVTGIQALTMDLTKLTSPVQLAIGPARFVDTTSGSPWLLGLLLTLDLFTLWRIALMAIGLRVIGRTSKGAAWGFAIVAFVLLSLLSVRSAMQMIG